MKRLDHRELAIVAKGLLSQRDGFTVDEFGREAKGNLWAVAVPGNEQRFSGRPSLDEVKAYLDAHPITEYKFCLPYFGGWRNAGENVTYLDHCLLWAHKHVAITEAINANQKAIFNLETKETVTIPAELIGGSFPFDDAEGQPINLVGQPDPQAEFTPADLLKSFGFEPC